MRDDGILTPDAARILNFLGFLAMIGVLAGAYVYEFYYLDVPCTLCLLQRLAMVAVAFGAAMNVVLGPDPRHYAVCLISAIFGGAISVRQTLLHINPFFDTTTSLPTLEATTNGPFGAPVWGLSLYVWGVILFATVILAVGIGQLFRRQFAAAEGRDGPGRLTGLAIATVAILFVVAAAETLTTFLECGFGDCPNDGGWVWWILG
jgi:disulfide bond formation protein DsbB